MAITSGEASGFLVFFGKTGSGNEFRAWMHGRIQCGPMGRDDWIFPPRKPFAELFGSYSPVDDGACRNGSNLKNNTKILHA